MFTLQSGSFSPGTDHSCVLQAEVDWDKGLPIDLLSTVAGGRDILKAMRGVSHTWQAGFEASVKSITVPWKAPPLPPASKFAERFPELISINLGESRLDQASLVSLAELRKLVSVSFESKFPTVPHLSPLRTPSETPSETPPETPLGVLGNSVPLGYRLTGAGLRRLNSLPLTKLVLRNCQSLSDACLRELWGLPLAILDLEGCPRLTDFGLKMLGLKGLPLTDLRMNWLANVTGNGLKYLREMTLTRLSLNYCSRLQSSDLEHLTGLLLASLTLGGFMTDDGMALLREFSLTDLKISRSGGVSDAGFAQLRDLRLTTLRPDLNSCFLLHAWLLQLKLQLTTLVLPKENV